MAATLWDGIKTRSWWKKRKGEGKGILQVYLATKLHLRGRVISFVAAHKKKTLADYRTATEKLRNAQLTYTHNPSQANKQQWKDSKAKYDLCIARYEKMKGDYARLKYHRYENKAGKMLSLLIKGTHKPTHISNKRNADS